MQDLQPFWLPLVAPTKKLGPPRPKTAQDGPRLPLKLPKERIHESKRLPASTFAQNSRMPPNRPKIAPRRLQAA